MDFEKLRKDFWLFWENKKSVYIRNMSSTPYSFDRSTVSFHDKGERVVV